jgi:hypothetical protein
LIEFEAPVPLQFSVCSFCWDRTIPLTNNGGIQQAVASSKTLAISKSDEFTVFVAAEREGACHHGAFERIFPLLEPEIDCKMQSISS